MNWLDLFIVLFLISSLIRGVEVGFIRQFSSNVGFIAGLFLGAWLEGKLVSHVHTPEAKVVMALCVIGGTMMVLTTVGEYAGLRLKFLINSGNLGNKLDRIFGSIVAGVTLLAAVWFGAAIFRNLPAGMMQRQIRSSRIIALLDRGLPSAPSVLTSLGHFIDPNGFPQVFSGLEPSLQTDAPLPNMGDLNAAVQAVRPSVVKIEGKGCGGIVEGSGFVAGTNEIVTNAHVVAGVTQPYVVDQAGQHRATVVLFDPDLDIAILKAQVNDKPLSFNTSTADSGTAAAVLGYPGGGGFTAGPAAILDSFVATGRNIYNQGQTDRAIYSVKVEVQQGNSGGPLIDKNGAVIGVIFAKSTTYNTVGYALTMQPVAEKIRVGADLSMSVGTGACAE